MPFVKYSNYAKIKQKQTRAAGVVLKEGTLRSAATNIKLDVPWETFHFTESRAKPLSFGLKL